MRAKPQAAGVAIDRTARETIRRLRTMGDPARAADARRYFKHEVASLGITAPALRAFARDRARELHALWPLAHAVRLCDRLLREPEMEIRGAGFLILATYRNELTPNLLETVERWLARRLDNWALVDGFCGEVLSPLLKQHPGVATTLGAWSQAKSPWLRRAALVTLVPSARHGRHLDLVYRLAREHFTDPEDLMHKATGWLLREAGKTDPARLRRFLLRHGPAMPRTSLRYAIERFPPSVRTTLLQSTRPPTPTKGHP